MTMTPLIPSRPFARNTAQLRRTRSLVLMPLMLLLAHAQATAAAMVDVHRRTDRTVQVIARATVKSDLRIAWETLVDYERLPEFVPDMRSSRALQRTGDQVLVQQSGRAGLGPIKRDFSLTLSVQETPMHSVTAYAVAGDFSRFESTYRLIATEQGVVRLEYDASIEPRDGIPPLVGVTVMRWAIERQFNALLQEIERRASEQSPERQGAVAAPRPSVGS